MNEKHVGVCDMAQNPVRRRAVIRGSIHTEPDNTSLARECAVCCRSRLSSSSVVVVCGSVNRAPKLFASVRQMHSHVWVCRCYDYHYRRRSTTTLSIAKSRFCKAGGWGRGISRSWIFQLTRYNDFLRAELSMFRDISMQLKQTS